LDERASFVTNLQPDNMEVVILSAPVLPSVFASELRASGAGQYIEY
jgi:hypothetical protein